VDKPQAAVAVAVVLLVVVAAVPAAPPVVAEAMKAATVQPDQNRPAPETVDNIRVMI